MNQKNSHKSGRRKFEKTSPFRTFLFESYKLMFFRALIKENVLKTMRYCKS